MLGDPIDPLVLSRAFRRLAKNAGLGSLGPHVLRHTSSTLMHEANIPAKVASDRLGHSDTRMTLEHYTHPSAAADADAAGKLDKVLRSIADPETGHQSPEQNGSAVLGPEGRANNRGPKR
jgi:integrase